MASAAHRAALVERSGRELGCARLCEHADGEETGRHEVVAVGLRPQSAPAGLRRPPERTGRQLREEKREIGLVGRLEEELCRAADAEPGDFAQRLVGDQPAANLGNPGKLRDEIGPGLGFKAHGSSGSAPISLPNSAGSCAAHCVMLPAPSMTT